MMGDKLNLMFWDMPEDGNNWRVAVHPNGEIDIKFYDPVTKLHGKMTFDNDSEVDFVQGIMTRIGFKRKVR